MSGSEPTATVVVGRHVLAVGDPAGTLIELGAAGGDVTQLAAGLERPALGRAAKEAKEAVGAISEATGRAEEAVQRFRAVADGSIDISELRARSTRSWDCSSGLMTRAAIVTR